MIRSTAVYCVCVMTICAVGGIAMAKMPQAAPYILWGAPSTVKILRDAPAGMMPEEGLVLKAARNEYESVQLCVTAGDADVRIVKAAASDLTGPAVLGADNIHICRVAYVAAPTHPEPMPDPLPPMTEVTVPAGETQPLWITVYVPPGTPAGQYTGEFRIADSAGNVASVPLRLTVWDFDVPVTPHLRTAFGISEGYLNRAHGVEDGSKAATDLYAKYYEELLRHRICAYSIPADLTSPEAAKYLNDPRMNAFCIPWSDDEAELKRVADHLRAHGWLEKGWYYPLDEPVNRQAYDTLTARVKKLKRVVPDAKVTSPFYRGPDFAEDKTIVDLMTGLLNIWCPNSGYWGCVEEQMRERQKQGEEVWWYVCCGPGEPYPNLFVDMEAIQHRLLPWQNWVYNVSGILYWSTTFWNPDQTEDVWEDIATVKSISPNIYGDGSLFYPGAKVGVNGPVSSIRLEMLRDGLEDYEYLWLLARKKGRVAADRAARKLIDDQRIYERDPAKLYAVREKIAREIQ